MDDDSGPELGPTEPIVETLVQLDANVDDLDPRLLPHAIDRLLETGAVDAWITPIVMKKGRPAFTVSALTRPDHLDAVRSALFRETSTIGVRETTLSRHALGRRRDHVEVDGRQIGVKIAHDHTGEIVHVGIEWDDVEAIATATGRSARDVLALAQAAAAQLR